MIENIYASIFSNFADCVYGQLASKPKALQEHHKLVLFGDTGSLVSLFQDALISKGLRLHFIIDNNPDKWVSMSYDAILTYSPEQIISEYRDNAIVLIPSRNKAGMLKQLKSLCFPEEQIIVLPAEDDIVQQSQEHILKSLRRMEHRELQLALLDILKVFRDFCDANKLKYFIANGTLLGAVRHQGFIPWDNDVDVYMPFEDREFFFSTYPDEGIFKTWHWKKNQNMHGPHGCFVDTRTICFGPAILPLGFCIHPLTGYPDTPLEIQQKFALNKTFEVNWRRWYHINKSNSSSIDVREDILKLQFAKSFYGSPMVGTGSSIYVKGKEYGSFALPYSDFSETVLLKFEDDCFSAPKGYDSYLRTLYGDYMQLPPENERTVHAHRAYWI